MGPLGFIVGPVILAIFEALLEIYETEKGESLYEIESDDVHGKGFGSVYRRYTDCGYQLEGCKSYRCPSSRPYTRAFWQEEDCGGSRCRYPWKECQAGRLGVFEELQSKLGLNEGDKVMLDYAKKPTSISFIRKKLDGGVLKAEETYTIVNDIVHDELTDEELSYYVSGCYTRGMTMQEAIDLTRATVDTGDRIRPKDGQVFLDKHCIGGIPNNRTTMIAVPILIAAGLKVPKTSSRSITSPAGTADTMEVLAPVTLPLAKMERMVKEIGGFITWGRGFSCRCR